MAHWVDSIGNWMLGSYAGQCAAYMAALMMAAVAVALIDDWWKRTRQMRREASVAALEALFALPDTRDCEQKRY